MFDLQSLPISGGVIIAGASWLAISSLVLGPIIAPRTIEQSRRPQLCERQIHEKLQTQIPQKQSTPKLNCLQIGSQLGHDAHQLCKMGSDIFVGLISLDPTINAREALRLKKIERLNQIAEQAPSACSCASQTVASDKIRWGLYAGSARLVGNIESLQSDLQQALHSSSCSALLEG